MYVSLSLYIYIYIYTHKCIHTDMHVYIYIYIYICVAYGKQDNRYDRVTVVRNSEGARALVDAYYVVYHLH